MIVLEGIDGSGKTTLSPLVANLISGRFMSKKTIPRRPPFVEKTLQNLAEAIWKSGEGTDFPHEFYLNLQLAWHIAQSTFLEAAERDSQPIVVDGWYYKFLAKLAVRGYDIDDLIIMFAKVRVPDQVVLLSVDVQEVWQRRSQFRDGELGLHAGYTQLGRASFVDYQSRVSLVLKQLADRLNWKILRVPSSQDVIVTATRIAEQLALHN